MSGGPRFDPRADGSGETGTIGVPKVKPTGATPTAGDIGTTGAPQASIENPLRRPPHATGESGPRAAPRKGKKANAANAFGNQTEPRKMTRAEP
jgi:hypothetical protein